MSRTRLILCLGFAWNLALGGGAVAADDEKGFNPGALAYGLGFAATYYDSLGVEGTNRPEEAIRPAAATGFLWTSKKSPRIGFGPMLVIDTEVDFSSGDKSLGVDIGNIGLGFMVGFREGEEDPEAGKTWGRGLAIGIAYSLSSSVQGTSAGTDATSGHSTQVVLIYAFGKRNLVE